MRAEFLFVLALALFASAAPAPEAEANAAAAADAEAHAMAEADDSGSLVKRACKYNGCRCRVGTSPGMYCYGCDAVIYEGNHTAFPGDPTGWLFQCARSGGCCTYGSRGSCSGGRANLCGA